jgi:hypothetical protein
MPQNTIDQAMQDAVAHHQAGRWTAAERIYRQVLAALPGHADALHPLGVLACQAGRLDEALDLIGRAIAISPATADAVTVRLKSLSDVARGGVSILTTLDLPEMVARPPEHYEKTAVTLAGDRTRLSQLRAGLRPRMQSSPLMDGRKYAADVERAFRQMWQAWCRH